MKISLIGAGRVATQLGVRLMDCGHEIHQVYSRQMQNALQLANKLNAKAINELNRLESKADLFIIAVKDDAIETVAAQFPFKYALVVHTSGATPSTVLQPYFADFGVFYPLQTFSDNQIVDFNQLPICIDANSEGMLNILTTLAQSITTQRNIHFINDHQRAVLHVAAVFANNFVNHMFVLAEDLLAQEQISFELLKPLIQNTAQKIQKASPSNMQTGPAVREDYQTIQRHLEYLKALPEYFQAYQLITKQIISKQHHLE